MAGNTISVFKPVQRKNALRVALFVKLFKVVAVAVAVFARHEYARVEGQGFGALFVQKVGLELRKAHIIRLVVKGVYRPPYYAVDKVEFHLAVYVLLPVVHRAYQFFAVLRQPRIAVYRAHFVVYFNARLVQPADNLLRAHQQFFSALARKISAAEHKRLVSVVAVRYVLSFAREGGKVNNGIVLRLPHYGFKAVIGIFKVCVEPLNGRQLAVVAAQKHFYAKV